MADYDYICNVIDYDYDYIASGNYDYLISCNRLQSIKITITITPTMAPSIGVGQLA